VQRLSVATVPARYFSAKAHAVTRRGGFAVWIVALLLLVGAFAGNRLQAQDKGPSDDVAITKRVETALARDAILKTLDIKVATRDGVVNLTGFVRSLEDIARAGGVAKAVPGVSAVRNDLRVANRPSQA
jgi:hypothetical protein